MLKMLSQAILIIISFFLFCSIIVVCDDGQEVEVVYFTFIHPLRWEEIVPYQLADLKATGLFAVTKQLNIVFTLDLGSESLVPSVKQAIARAVSNTSLPVVVEHHFANHFEYEGFKKLHERGKAFPNRVLLYFHGKGMVFHQQKAKGRIADEIALHNQVIKPWAAVLEIFAHNATVQKIGFSCTPEGSVWFNYFWVRGAYLSLCSPPAVYKDRYEYEHFLVKSCTENKEQKCFSMINLDPALRVSKEGYTGREALDALLHYIKELRGK